MDSYAVGHQDSDDDFSGGGGGGGGDVEGGGRSSDEDEDLDAPEEECLSSDVDATSDEEEPGGAGGAGGRDAEPAGEGTGQPAATVLEELRAVLAVAAAVDGAAAAASLLPWAAEGAAAGADALARLKTLIEALEAAAHELAESGLPSWTRLDCCKRGCCLNLLVAQPEEALAICSMAALLRRRSGTARSQLAAPISRAPARPPSILPAPI